MQGALLMYTYDAARFGHAETTTGRLAPGYAADFVVLEGDPIASGSFDGVRVAQTWSDGIGSGFKGVELKLYFSSTPAAP